jgi:hypothetical protein
MTDSSGFGWIDMPDIGNVINRPQLDMGYGVSCHYVVGLLDLVQDLISSSGSTSIICSQEIDTGFGCPL